MTPWITLLARILWFSSNYVDTYRFFNFGQAIGPRSKLQVPRPIVSHQPLVNCFLNNNWSECAVVPKNMLFKVITNPHGRGPYGAYHQSERLLQRLFEVGHNPNNEDSRVHTENESPPSLFYPYLPMHGTTSSWLSHRRTFNENTLSNPSYPRTTTSASPLTIDSLLTKFLLNRGQNSKRPITDTDTVSFHTTSSPETSPMSIKSGESMENNTMYESTPPTGIVDANVHNSIKEGSITYPPIITGSLLETSNTDMPPIKSPHLIHNVDIGVNTKSDDILIKKYATTNDLTGVTRYLNHTVKMFSRNNFSEVSSTTLNPEEFKAQKRKSLLDSYLVALDKLERKFYAITFNKLTSTSPLERRENGISFVQSGLFLSLQLMAFSTATNEETKSEIDQCLGLNITVKDKINIIEDVISNLPKSSFDLKWRWSSRLVLGAAQNVSDDFRYGAASALKLSLGKFRGDETHEVLAQTLNQMIEKDSGGAIRDTFDPVELSEGVRAVALSTLYLRGRWRSAPTVLNDTRPFRDADGTPPRSVRMIRINDYVRYANFEDWNFQAIEIFYATRGLSLLMLVPHGRSLRVLAGHLETVSISEITRRMILMQVAVTMPLYTLRMTLLLPSKLKALGVNKLLNGKNSTDSGQLKLSHAVQRLMFWAEAGRNAFKDDGIEWDAEPELEIVVDRPYLFFVRWHNITLMNGNFVL